jgi:hypothetical protein
MPNCGTYFQEGVRSAVLAGYNAQRMAACNIYRIQKGISAPGLGKKGGRSTRRRSTRRRSSTRRS